MEKIIGTLIVFGVMAVGWVVVFGYADYQRKLKEARQHGERDKINLSFVDDAMRAVMIGALVIVLLVILYFFVQ